MILGTLTGSYTAKEEQLMVTVSREKSNPLFCIDKGRV